MRSIKSYSLKHLALNDLTPLTEVTQNCLYYFWWKTIPLGHLWVDDKKLSLTQFHEIASVQILQTLRYYISSFELNNFGDLKKFFTPIKLPELNIFLDKHLTKVLIDKEKNCSTPISVVICTRNRPQAIESCIQSLLDSSDTNFELIVVDNAPDDNSTKKVVEKFAAARYVLEPRKGLDNARNTGARHASHDIIAYTDDDVIIEKNWIKNIKACFDNPNTMAVTGLVIPTSVEKRSQYLFERFWGFNKGYLPVHFEENYFNTHVKSGVPVWNIGAGANMAFRKEVFNFVGYFDERLDVGAAGCSGDSEMWYRILANGYNCFYCPQVFVYHMHRDNDEALTNQIFHYMRGQIASVLVQYEAFEHKGNLKRLYFDLPKFYGKRIAHRIIKGYTERNTTLWTEIRGCISGWCFYQSVKKSTKDKKFKRGNFKSVEYENTIDNLILQ